MSTAPGNFAGGNLAEMCDAYVLGSLEGQELAEMRELLRRVEAGETDQETKERVTRAMQISEEAAALLAWDAKPLKPPRRLRERVLGAVGAEADGRTSVVEMMAPRKAKPSPMVWLGWAAAAALAVVAFTLNNRAGTAESNLAEAQGVIDSLRGDVAEQRRVMAVIGARDSRAIRLVTTAPEAPQFRAYWSETAGLVLTGTGVTAPKPGRTMQLWIVPKKGMPISAGVFEPGPQGEVLLIAAANLSTPEMAQALAISDEPMGGSPQPTTQPAWIGAVGGF